MCGYDGEILIPNMADYACIVESLNKGWERDFIGGKIPL